MHLSLSKSTFLEQKIIFYIFPLNSANLSSATVIVLSALALSSQIDGQSEWQDTMYPLLLLYICGSKVKSAELIYHSSNRAKTWHNNKEVNLMTSHGNFINHKGVKHIETCTLQSQV